LPEVLYLRQSVRVSENGTALVVEVDDAAVADIRELLRTHLVFAQEVTPEGHVHALPVNRLLDPSVTLVSARADGVLLGVGALKRLADEHAEIKAMHTAAAARGHGVGRAVLERLVSIGRERGYQRLSLETGTMDAFAPARSLYLSAGFVPCEPFGEYTANPHSVCMTMSLGGADSSTAQPRASPTRCRSRPARVPSPPKVRPLSDRLRDC
jgi:putative acetyltransferase